MRGAPEGLRPRRASTGNGEWTHCILASGGGYNRLEVATLKVDPYRIPPKLTGAGYGCYPTRKKGRAFSNHPVAANEEWDKLIA